MSATEVEKLITKTQRQAMIRDLRHWISDELSDLVSGRAEKYAAEWLKENEESIKAQVAEICDKEIGKILKRGIKLNVSFRDYY